MSYEDARKHLVGIADNGKIMGVDIEINKFHQGSSDKFCLHVRNLIKERIGAEFYPYIEYTLTPVNSNNVLVVDGKKSRSPCYLNNIDFYVRINLATDKLEELKLVQYINNHFNQQKNINN